MRWSARFLIAIAEFEVRMAAAIHSVTARTTTDEAC